ncbi:hypothetical protein AT15_03945 [Kosmotoga arenicorallina S304]|uniref:Uncharacterized protein n=1 Tax=Kosmotoga arenicorallina S304 TaxID=1453497 RepID=A0A176JYX1_9BACT|nr:hypothetical protein [Kosmotoga arenicorallina]OAA29151.1 hypothetical protein AT15_03945 [Kosmotoga arenicorallina S304]
MVVKRFLVMLMGLLIAVTAFCEISILAPDFDLGPLNIENPATFNNQEFWFEVLRDSPVTIMADYEIYIILTSGDVLIPDKFLDLFLTHIFHYENGSYVNENITPWHQFPDDGSFYVNAPYTHEKFWLKLFFPYDYQANFDDDWCIRFKSAEYRVEIVITIIPEPPGGGGDGHVTYTPGGWGAPPHGNNPGAYLHANFSTAFPEGLTIGVEGVGRYVRFTSAQAITDYLPAGGTPATISTFYVNPATTDLSNELVTQMVALALNIGFDLYDPDFAPATSNLAGLVLGYPLSVPPSERYMEGMTVAEIMALANQILAGESTAYTPSQVTDVITIINENFDNGTTDNGYLH